MRGRAPPRELDDAEAEREDEQRAGEAGEARREPLVVTPGKA